MPYDAMNAAADDLDRTTLTLLWTLGITNSTNDYPFLAAPFRV
ncbi:MAG: hypothetical protein WBF42_11560 [Terracidiphilus sp.]